MAYSVRGGRVEDAEELVRIWRSGLLSSLGSPPPSGLDDVGYFRHRLETQDEVFRYFVVEDGAGDIVAWQSLSPFRSNPAVVHVMAELSAYADPAKSPGFPTLQGLQALFAHADQSPLHYVVAFITLENPKAYRLAEHFGMRRAGTLPRTPKKPENPELAYYVYPCGTPTEREAFDAYLLSTVGVIAER